MRTNGRSGAILRFGLVGTGRIAQAYAQAFSMTTNARLVAVSDLLPDAARAFAEQSGCAVWPSHLDLAHSGAVDAIVIATPPDCHRAICLDFLRCGVPVLCEKPVGFRADAARAIRTAAGARGVLFTMASKFRYAEDVVRARDMVDSGVLGDIVLFENTFMSFVDMTARWNSDRRVSGGGVFIDNGTHSVDIMRYFIGPLSMIHAVEGPRLQRLPVEETVHITARAAQGAIGRMDLSWSITKQSDDYIVIYGSKGVLRVGWKGSFYRQVGRSQWVQFGNGYNKVQAFCDQISNFSAAIQNLEPLRIDADDAVASVAVIQAGYESLARDSWTPIPSDAEAGAELRSAEAGALHPAAVCLP